MGYAAPYKIIKLGTSKFRGEINKLMKPRGFTVKIRTSNKSYWKDGSVNINITTPDWFEYHVKDNYKWERTENAKKMIASFKKRLSDILYEIAIDNAEGYTWNYNNDISATAIKDNIDWTFEFNGY